MSLFGRNHRYQRHLGSPSHKVQYCAYQGVDKVNFTNLARPSHLWQPAARYIINGDWLFRPFYLSGDSKSISASEIPTMKASFKALVFDLGGVLLEWDRHSIDAITPEQFLTITNSTTWHSLDRGNVTLKEACKVMLLASVKIEFLN